MPCITNPVHVRGRIVGNLAVLPLHPLRSLIRLLLLHYPFRSLCFPGSCGKISFSSFRIFFCGGMSVSVHFARSGFLYHLLHAPVFPGTSSVFGLQYPPVNHPIIMQTMAMTTSIANKYTPFRKNSFSAGNPTKTTASSSIITAVNSVGNTIVFFPSANSSIHMEKSASNIGSSTATAQNNSIRVSPASCA